jgi:hypothetical protein
MHSKRQKRRVQRKERKQKTMTEAEYDKLPVVNWKEIMGANHPPYKRRPRRMHNSMYLNGVCWWVEKLFGVPRNAIRFVRGNGQLIAPEDHYLVNVKQLQEEAQRDALKKQIERAFAPLHERLRTLERRLNPSEQNLHFGGQLNVVPKDFDELLALASEGLRTVRNYDAYFKKHGLYERDGFFWYDLCLLISVASRQGLTVSESVLRPLVEVLVDMSQYSLATGGDMVKRNHEALGNLLWGFSLPSLQAIARARAKQSPQVNEFVAMTLADVAKLQPKDKQMAGKILNG